MKMTIAFCLCIAILIAGVGIGSSFIPPGDVLRIIGHKLFNHPLPGFINETSIAIIWTLRLPRALLAFLVGGALAVSGTVMQSVLKNPLASSYTVGVSSGAGLGAGIVMVTGLSLPLMPMLTLPFFGLIFGLSTVVLALSLSSGLDKNMENHTIILTGMILSLFINAILTLIMSMSKDALQRLVFWQMGSFALKSWRDVAVLSPLVFTCILFLMRFSRELDIMTFGEEQAVAIGVDMKRTKWILLGTSAALTGSAISFVGVVGFIDLIAPHVVRKFFGASHRFVMPLSALFGGAFMVLADLVARTVISPSELPVGAVTALIGAPFFASIYYRKK